MLVKYLKTPYVKFRQAHQAANHVAVSKIGEARNRRCQNVTLCTGSRATG